MTLLLSKHINTILTLTVLVKHDKNKAEININVLLAVVQILCLLINVIHLQRMLTECLRKLLEEGANNSLP